MLCLLMLDSHRPSRCRDPISKSLGRAPAVLVVLACASLLSTSHADELDDLARKAHDQLASSEFDAALATANSAVDRFPDDWRARWLRAGVLEKRGESEQALADCDWLLAPQRAKALAAQSDVYDLRGRVRFRLADIRGSVEDFDKAVELAPQRGPGHWQRGIAYYYAGRFDDGRRQFEGYQTVDKADVENAVWRYLCMARTQGSDAARRDLLRVGDDRRVPMREIYEMFAGRLKPDDVLDAARSGDVSADERDSRCFYAQLYVGLFLESEGDMARSLEAIRLAAQKHPTGHYMADVARTHVKLRDKGTETKK